MKELIIVYRNDDDTWSASPGSTSDYHYGNPYAALAACRGEAWPNVKFAREAGRKEGLKLASTDEIIRELRKRVTQ